MWRGVVFALHEEEPMIDVLGDEALDGLTIFCEEGEPKIAFRSTESVDLEEALRMLRVLRSLHKGLRKFEELWGPVDFAGYVFRLASLLHAKEFLVSGERLSLVQGIKRLEAA